MITQRSIQPIELVISAIHCLKERKGSSPKEILKYLEEKYDVCEEVLKTEVEAGLKRGVSFGLIYQRGGLYRLNDILRSPMKAPTTKPDKIQKIKIRKTNIGLKRLKIGKLTKKIGKTTFTFQNRKKKAQCSKARRKIKPKKLIKARNLRRQTDLRRRKFRRVKSKPEKTLKPEKTKKSYTDNGPEDIPLKTEGNGKI